MSSKPRIIVPDSIYHICSTGVFGLKMFSNNKECFCFLDQLKQTAQNYHFKLLAFSLIKNQYFLIIKSSEESISAAMQHLNSNFAKKFNKLRGRNGTVFARRFDSVIVEECRLKELISIVHLKPVNAGECSFVNLDSYKWSSHNLLVNENGSDFIDPNATFEAFGDSDHKNKYMHFIRSSLSEKKENNELRTCINDANSGKQSFRKSQCWIIGSDDFVQDILNKDRCRRAKIARHISENVSMTEMVKKVEMVLFLDKDEILKQGRFDVRSTARELFVYIGKYRYDFSCAQLAFCLGVTDSAVSKMIKRFEKIEKRDFLIKEVTLKRNNCDFNFK